MVSLASLGGGSTISIILRAVDEFSGTITKADKAIGTFSDNVAKKVGIAGAALTTAGIGGAFAIKGLAEEAGKGSAVTQVFNKMLGEKAPIALEKMRAATRGTVNDVDLMTQANQAMLLGIDPDALPTMFEGAFAAAQAKARPTAEAIEDITTGLGRQSPLILDNLGIKIKQSEVDEMLAKKEQELGRKLTEAEKSAGFNTLAMIKLKENTERIGEITDNAAIATQRASAQWDNATQSLGVALAPVLISVTNLLSKMVGWFTSLSPNMQKFIGYSFAAATALALVVGPILTLVAFLPAISAGLAAIGIAGAPVFLTIGLIAAAVFGLIALFVWWDEITGWLTEKFGVFGDVILYLVGGPFVLLIAAIKNWAVIKEIVTNVFDFVKEKIGSAIEWVKQKITSIIDTARAVWDTVVSIFSTPINVVTNAASSVASKAKSAVSRGTARNDFVMRPGQSPVNFSPDDTIIGIKDPSKLGGNGSTINVHIDTVQGLNAEDVARSLQGMLLTTIRQ